MQWAGRFPKSTHAPQSHFLYTNTLSAHVKTWLLPFRLPFPDSNIGGRMSETTKVTFGGDGRGAGTVLRSRRGTLKQAVWKAAGVSAVVAAPK